MRAWPWMKEAAGEASQATVLPYSSTVARIESYGFLGDAYAHLGESEKASEHFQKLEEKNPDFASKTEKLVALNREIDMINNPKANVRVESNIDKRQLPKSGGNVLTGN